MFKKSILALLLLLILSAHDMYLKFDTYFFEPDTEVSLMLFNGTFDRSENVITRDRMLDVSLVGNGIRTAVDNAQWSEKGDTTLLRFNTGDVGTWIAGVSTAPRNIEMTADDFNNYLEHDGVVDMLEWRKQNNALGQDAVEKYSKHVKTIFQVGNELSSDWKTVLGYPIEFVPLNNPYNLHAGHDMHVQLLWQGEPLANQLVYVGSNNIEEAHTHANNEEHSHDAEEHTHADGTTHSHATEEAHSHEEKEQEMNSDDHEHNELQQFRTDTEGKITIPIDHQGVWYLRTIYLTTSEEEGLTHESNWATLTFEIGEGHEHSHNDTQGSAHSHDDNDDHGHDHEDSIGIPSYVYWLGSVLLVIALFFWFNKKEE
jgi:uncharacterized GH25 family protein